MLLCLLLQSGDSKHRKCHADRAYLEPGLAAESVEVEDGDPGAEEEGYSYASCGEICGLGVCDASFLEQRRLSMVSFV